MEYGTKKFHFDHIFDIRYQPARPTITLFNGIFLREEKHQIILLHSYLQTDMTSKIKKKQLDCEVILKTSQGASDDRYQAVLVVQYFIWSG